MNTIFRKVRQALGLSQSQLAEEMNVKQAAIAKYEREGGRPSLDAVSFLFHNYQVSANYLIGNFGPMFLGDIPPEISSANILIGKNNLDKYLENGLINFNPSDTITLPFIKSGDLRSFEVPLDSVYVTGGEILICRLIGKIEPVVNRLFFIVTQR